MEESRKRPVSDGDGGCSGEVLLKRARNLARSDDEEESNGEEESGGGGGGDVLAWLTVDEEMIGELAKLLEEDVTSPVKVRFIEDPYTTPLIFQSSASYVTINGNEESCGSSFSDSDSSVMVSVDTSGIKRLYSAAAATAITTTAPAPEDVEWTEWFGSGGGGGLDGCDWLDFDDDVLARFLGDENLME